MTLDDIRSLDIRNAGSWPIPIKALSLLLVLVAVLGIGYFLDIQAQLETLDRARIEEKQLRLTFENKSERAANLDLYVSQLVEMERSFGSMLRRLPNKNEVSELLVDVSQTGLSNGLEFNLFKPKAERVQEFYAELPIDIRVKGSYHQFAQFVSGLSALPRIVTVHNVTIKGIKKELSVSALLKTYRYLGDEE